MILAWQLGRGVSWLKRLALAAERLADAADTLVSIAREDHPIRRPPQHTQFDVATVDDWNAKWREENPSDEPNNI